MDASVNEKVVLGRKALTMARATTLSLVRLRILSRFVSPSSLKLESRLVLGG